MEKPRRGFIERMGRFARVGVAAANFVVGGHQILEQNAHLNQPMKSERRHPGHDAAAVNYLESKVRGRGGKKKDDGEALI